jgi:histidine ammonia-lyase
MATHGARRLGRRLQVDGLRGAKRVYERVRERVEFLAEDRPLSPDLVALAELVARGGLDDVVPLEIGAA